MSKAIPPKRTLIEYVVDAIVLVAVGVPFLAWCGGAVFAMTRSLPGFAVGAIMLIAAYMLLRYWLQLDEPHDLREWKVDKEVSTENLMADTFDDIADGLSANPDVHSGDHADAFGYRLLADSARR